ncbi:MAG: DUF5372 family protein [Gammaproteobacteria bacterium]
MTRRQTWGEDRVNYFDHSSKLCSMLASWTSVAAVDFFARASAGRSWFRVDDLLTLNELVTPLLERDEKRGRDVK